MMPKRVQMSRQHHWRAENPDAVIVARPSEWGNVVAVGAAVIFGDFTVIADHPLAVAIYRRWVDGHPAFVETIRLNLSGKDLACWCPLSQPCHADVLLELANGVAL